ncbi:hypothetical protein NLN94_06185, partial [Citrobacter portucalensis]|uniref:hypothetical protein n=1 Tax=Citrobacter portucalensis TaxID=1639133 RepID=UPI00226B5A9F
LILWVNYILRVMRKVEEKIHCINTNGHGGVIYFHEKQGGPLKMNLYISGVNIYGEKFGI